ncbi:MAG: N-acetylmuramoyl-L-alanine amidase [Lachnospiraceae bacterium]|nr:N-acetylmuramoyl-L-alanine amidase [Lachnospiraceae bacterium]
MKVKKLLMCVAVGVVLSTSLTGVACGANYKAYQPANEIIVSAPSDGYVTKSEKISILGACNPKNELYINGELVEITESGFFADYVQLKDGENVFQFKNGNKSKTLTVIKEASQNPAFAQNVVQKAPEATQEQQSTQEPQTTQEPKQTQDENKEANLYDEKKAPIYGVVNRNNISHRTNPDESNALLTPLTKGTTTQIIGETDEYYRIYDGTYIYKETLDVKEGKLEKNKITHISFEPEAKENTAQISFNMDYAALYSLTADKEKAVLTVFNTKVFEPDELTKTNLLFKDVKAVQEGENAVYTVYFKEGFNVYGRGVVFDGKRLILSLKKAPILEEHGTLKGAKIVIDAGHGDTDVGAVGPAGANGPTEKDINLQIALAARNYLEGKGAKVVMTRSDDTFIPLNDRVNIILNEKPDLAISIHGNSLPITSDYTNSSGLLTFYTYKDINGAVSFMNTNIAGLMDFSGKEPRQSNLALTRITDCPAMLFETKFLSNPQDYEWLIKQENQKKFGEAIGRATEKYVESIASYKY